MAITTLAQFGVPGPWELMIIGGILLVLALPVVIVVALLWLVFRKKDIEARPLPRM